MPPQRIISSVTIAALCASSLFAAEITLRDHLFTVPDGFEVTVAAAPPLVNRPIVADFDEQGRLYVAESSGTNESVQKQLEERPHSILRLTDTDGDGEYDQRTVFADRMMFPEGCMWLNGSLYVAAPPSIWKLTDADNDGVAELREEWFAGKTLTGCANDLHGPYLGPDGYIYWCKGAFAEQTYQRPNDGPFVTRAAHIFRCRVDGSGIEPVMTGGMDNPVELAFTPAGERIFTTTFFQHPGGGRRDGLVHAIYGGVYGKIHDVIDDHPRTGEIMPVLTHLGPAAPSGLTLYRSQAFGESYRNDLFAALFNLRKVTRHKLVASGATFVTEDHDFLVSNNRDFHPTDVVEDADGSLLVVDTGGWYKLCCPTSQLWKPDILGAIYRLRRKAAPKIADPRGLDLEWQEPTNRQLIHRLRDSRFAVRQRAIRQLAALHTPQIVEGLQDSLSAGLPSELDAVWTLTRIEGEGARSAIRSALDAKDQDVRVAAIHSAGLWRDELARPMLLQLLHDPSAHVRRAAAEAIGRLGDSQAVGQLLAASAEACDRSLEHSLIYALIEIADPSATRAGLTDPRPLVRRAALIAMDQMVDSDLTVTDVVPHLNDQNVPLKEAAYWIVQRHPEWSEDKRIVDWIGARLAEELPSVDRKGFEPMMVALADQPAISDLLVATVSSNQMPVSSRILALAAMGQSRSKRLADGWAASITHALGSSDPSLAAAAVSTARRLLGQRDQRKLSVGGAELARLLLEAAMDETNSHDVRSQALATIAGQVTSLPPAAFKFLCQNIASQQSVAVRTLSADALSRAKLNPAQLLALTKSVAVAGPLEIGVLLRAFDKQTDVEIGRQLLHAISRSRALSALTPAALAHLDSFPVAIQEEAELLLAGTNLDTKAQRAHLDQLFSNLPDGDVRRGQVVFNSSQAACASCHSIGYVGGKLGPDLTRIGQIRERRDLLESVVFPSASFVRSYEPTVVVTHDGKQTMGIVTRNSPDEITLVSQPEREERIAREEIAEMLPGSVSVMPAGLDKVLTQQQFADLLAFLMAAR